MRRKILIIIAILAVLGGGVGVTYSYFKSENNLDFESLNAAKFIFNAEETDTIEIPLNDLKPGDVTFVPFSVTNTVSNLTSEVAIEYELSIKTYHFIPLLIELYKINGNEEELLLTCDENEIRNSSNELVFTTDTFDLPLANTNDEYKLKVTFPSTENDEVYANLVDYIDIEINSSQKI